MGQPRVSWALATGTPSTHPFGVHGTQVVVLFHGHPPCDEMVSTMSEGEGPGNGSSVLGTYPRCLVATNLVGCRRP